MDYTQLSTTELLNHMQQLTDALQSRLFKQNEDSDQSFDLKFVILDKDHNSYPTNSSNTPNSPHMEAALEASWKVFLEMFLSFPHDVTLAKTSSYECVKKMYYHLTFYHLTK